MSSNLRIERKCQYCGSLFTAKTTVTKYCGDVCGKRAYKAKKRKEKIERVQVDTGHEEIRKPDVLPVGDYLTVNDAAVLLKCSPRTVHRMVKNNQIPYTKLGERLTRIRRADLEKMFLNPDPVQEKARDYYLISEIVEKYGISQTELLHVLDEEGIPIIKEGEVMHVPRIPVDNLFMS